MSKEAKKYIARHKVNVGGKWMVPLVRANEAAEIAFEEGRRMSTASDKKEENTCEKRKEAE